MTSRSAAWTVSVVRAVPSTAAAELTSSVSRLMFVRLIFVLLTQAKDTPLAAVRIHIDTGRAARGDLSAAWSTVRATGDSLDWRNATWA